MEYPNQPIVTTTHGQVRGQLRETVYGDRYYCFDGIPYAKPPLRELRFKSPQPLESWLGVRDCTEVVPKCIQYNRYTDRIEGSEDCLYLNVYAKHLDSEKPLPVMVYIHGGGFFTNTASRLNWGPDYFMMKDVILVTIAYRLGALGFLSLPETELEVPGNAGLKDIVMALKWLKNNYHNFSGDPNNITLFGHSSGSQAVHILTAAPQCEGLFHKVILMSGFLMHTQDIPNLHYRFAKHVGYEGIEDNQNILNYLRSVEAKQLCDLNFLTQVEKEQNLKNLFYPTIENSNVADAIITKPPLDMYAAKQAWSYKIPMMLGTTSFEGLGGLNYYTSETLYDIYRVHPEYLFTYELLFCCNTQKQKQLAQKIIKLHMNDKQLNAENVMDVLRMISYDFIYHPAHHYLHSRLMNAKAPTYFYRFDFDSPFFNLYRIKLCGREVRGVSHVDDLCYIFYIPQSFKLARDTAEFKTIERMIGLLTSFAANSDPNVDNIVPLLWQPLTKQGTRKCLNISNEISFIDWPEEEKCKISDQYYAEADVRVF